MRNWLDSEMYLPQGELESVDFRSTSAGQIPAPSPTLVSPDVTVVARRFGLSEDLVIETQLRCWEVAEQQEFEGTICVTYSADALGDGQDVYTAAIKLSNARRETSVHGMGADPYEALARALSLI